MAETVKVQETVEVKGAALTGDATVSVRRAVYVLVAMPQPIPMVETLQKTVEIPHIQFMGRVVDAVQIVQKTVEVEPQCTNLTEIVDVRVLERAVTLFPQCNCVLGLRP